MKKLLIALTAIVFSTGSMLAEAAPHHGKHTVAHTTHVKKAQSGKAHTVKKAAAARKASPKRASVHKHR